MKKIYLILLLCFPFLMLSAQNWRPVCHGEKANYSLGDTALFSTVWVDSISISGADSIYHFNRIIEKCDSCQLPPLTWVHAIYLKNHPNLFLQNARIRPDQSWVLSSGSKNLLICPANPPGASWLYDTLNNITASVIHAADTNVLGYPDSVKTILLSTNQRILISKNSGIIQSPFQDDPSHHVSLIGLEKRGLGYRTPYFDDIFSFNVGDVFFYKNYKGEGSYKNESIEKREIISRTCSPGSYSYSVRVLKKFTEFENNQLVDTYYSSAIETESYSNCSFYSKNINQPLEDTVICDSYYKPVCVGYDSVFKTRTKSYCANSFMIISADTVEEYGFPPLCNYTKREIYGNHMGLIKYAHGYTNVSNMTGTFTSRTLEGAVINGKEYGTVYPDNDFYVLKEEVTLLSNPTDGAFSFSFLSINENISVNIYDLSGRLVYNGAFKNQQTVHLQLNILPGTYLLDIKGDSAKVCKKLVMTR